jgi:predicted nicotinamide N-methyase
MNREPAAPSSRQALPETPLDALGRIIRERVIINGKSFLIDRPEESDKTLEHPAIRAEFAVDEYLPFWTELWPASRMLAKVLLREEWPPGIEMLEVGCGLGLPGIAALSRGARVTFSDLDATALRFAAANARLNGFDEFHKLQFDWNFPPEGLQVPVILAADLIYELRAINPLVALIKRVLSPDGVCLLTDQDRLPAYNLTDALVGEGLMYTTEVLHAGSPGKPRMRGTLYRIRRRQ